MFRIPSLKRILCVDDEEIFRVAISKMLEKDGLEVKAVTDTEAIAAALEFKPDMILLDVQMPKFDGFQLFEIIRNTEAISRTPIVFITGVEDEKQLNSYLKRGACGVIPKPLNLSRLACALGVIWHHHQRAFPQFVYNFLHRG